MSLLTVRQVAEDLNVCERTIYNLIHSGKIAYIKVLGALRIPPEALQKFKEENLFQANSDRSGRNARAASVWKPEESRKKGNAMVLSKGDAEFVKFCEQGRRKPRSRPRT